MINGILNVYKEAGFTSHDVVAKLRGICGQKKIGHTGTLDPDAVGVLPVCLGSATRLCDMLTDRSKAYEAVLLLGKVTDTQDISGNVLEEHPVDVTPKQAEEAIRSFIGEQEQIPPMYSALKVNGKKLYELARAGKEVERKARRIRITDIRIDRIELPRIAIHVECSKGTYIRTLCHDIGQMLGCGGTMESLKRTRVGSFYEKEALTLGQIEVLAREGRLMEKVIPVERMFVSCPKLIIQPRFEHLLENGNAFYPNQILRRMEGEAVREKDDSDEAPLPDGDGGAKQVRVGSEAGRFYGIYAFREAAGRYEPVKMFFT
jgi:tRNA pseudouridine55 synthase